MCVAAEPGVSLGCMVVTLARFNEPMLPLKAGTPLNMPGAACSFSRWVRVGGRFALPEAYLCLDEPVGRTTNSRSPCRGNGGLATRQLDPGAPADGASLRRCKVHGVEAVEVTSEAVIATPEECKLKDY